MRFHVKALHGSESVVSLELDAPDAADATRQASASGHHVLSLRPAQPWRLAANARAGRFPLTLFAEQLLALLGAGLTLTEAIDALVAKEPPGAVRTVLEPLAAQLRQGHTLSQAMQEASGAFPALFIASVRATERTGDVPEALRRYLAYQRQIERVRAKLLSASLYPMLLIGAGGLVLLFLVAYVVPKFSRIYEDMPGEMPLLSQLLLQAGRFMETHGIVAGVALVGAAAILVRFALLPSFRSAFAARLQRLPGIGPHVQVYQQARFYRTLGLLLRGGTPLVPALETCGGLLPVTMHENLRRAAAAIREGRAMSDAMEANGLATPLALRMLRVGEKSGRMTEMMDHIASLSDEEFSRWVDWFSRLFEPLLMAVIGVVIGGIVLLMYFPIFELAGRAGAPLMAEESRATARALDWLELRAHWWAAS